MVGRPAEGPKVGFRVQGFGFTGTPHTLGIAGEEGERGGAANHTADTHSRHTQQTHTADTHSRRFGPIGVNRIGLSRPKKSGHPKLA